MQREGIRSTRAMEDSHDDRRRAPRLLVRLDLALTFRRDGQSDTYSAELLNVSEEGVFLATKAPFAIGDPFRMDVDIDTDPVTLRGKMQWRGEIGGGALFTQPVERFVVFVRELATMSVTDRIERVQSVRNAHVLIGA